MKKTIAVWALCTLAACGGGNNTVSGPTSTETTPPVATTPQGSVGTPQTVTPPPATPQDGFDVAFSPNAGFSVKNTGGTARTIYAYTTSFDNQNVTTASKQGVTAAGDTFAGSFNTTCVQLDLSTESVGGRPDIGFAYFDKQGQVITVANRDAKVAECRVQPTPPPCVNVPVITYGAPSYGSWSLGQGELACGVRSKTVVKTTTNSCTQVQTTENVITQDTKECVCSVLNPNFGAVSGSGSKHVTVSTPHQDAVQTTYTYTTYWKMNQGNDTARENACTNRSINGSHGVWLNNFDIPGDGTGSTRENVCRFISTGTNPPGAPGADMDLYNPPGVVAVVLVQGHGAVAEKDSLTVTANWTVAAGAAQTLTFEIVYNINSDNFVKKSTSQTVSCGQGSSGSLIWGPGDTYNNSPNYNPTDGHITGNFTLRVKRGAAVVGTYPLP